MKFELKLLLKKWEQVLAETPDFETLPQEQQDALCFMQLLIDHLREFDKLVIKTIAENTELKTKFKAASEFILDNAKLFDYTDYLKIITQIQDKE